MKNKELFSVVFRVTDGYYNDLCGFVPVEHLENFEGGWNLQLIFHDTFEHFFEGTKYFKTESLSESGEVVAMGVRNWFIDSEYYQLSKYIHLNRYDINKNTIDVIINQVQESFICTESDDRRYLLDFKNYEVLPEIETENIFEGSFNDLSKNCEGLETFQNDIEILYSYGYNLAEYLFSDITDLIFKFMENFKILHEFMSLDKLEAYSMPQEWEINDRLFKISVRNDNIIGVLFGVTFSARMGEKIMNRKKTELYNKVNIDRFNY